MASHDAPPRSGTLSSQEVLAQLGQVPADYRDTLRRLAQSLRGKVVAGSRGGHSGYLLRFTDGTSALAFVQGTRLELEVLTQAPSPAELALLAQADVPDGSAPSAANLPNASQPCSIVDEIARSHGQPVTGIAVGSDCFSLCFPEGRELEALFVPGAGGRPALRVFWEQW